MSLDELEAKAAAAAAYYSTIAQLGNRKRQTVSQSVSLLSSQSIRQRKELSLSLSQLTNQEIYFTSYIYITIIRRRRKRIFN